MKIHYRLGIYKLWNRTISWIVRVAAARELPQDFEWYFHQKLKLRIVRARPQLWDSPLSYDNQILIGLFAFRNKHDKQRTEKTDFVYFCNTVIELPFCYARPWGSKVFYSRQSYKTLLLGVVYFKRLTLSPSLGHNKDNQERNNASFWQKSLVL